MPYLTLTLGTVSIDGYTLFGATALWAFCLLCTQTLRRAGWTVKARWLVALAALAGFLAGHLLFAQIEEAALRLQALPPYNGMWSIYGGLWGQLLAAGLASRLLRQPVLSTLDHLTPACALMDGCFRLGCFTYGCCHGVPTARWYGLHYINSPYAPNHVTLVPVQLLNAAGGLLLCGLLLWLLPRRRFYGQLLGWFLTLFGLLHIWLEPMRAVPQRMLGPWTVEYALAFPMVAMGAALLLWQYRKSRAVAR